MIKALRIFFLKRKKPPETRIATNIYFNGEIYYRPQFRDTQGCWNNIYTNTRYTCGLDHFEVADFQSLFGCEPRRLEKETECEPIIDDFLEKWEAKRKEMLGNVLTQQICRRYP